MGINYWGLKRVTEAMLPLLRQSKMRHGARVITVSSSAGQLNAARTVAPRFLSPTATVAEIDMLATEFVSAVWACFRPASSAVRSDHPCPLRQIDMARALSGTRVVLMPYWLPSTASLSFPLFSPFLSRWPPRSTASTRRWGSPDRRTATQSPAQRTTCACLTPPRRPKPGRSAASPSVPDCAAPGWRAARSRTLSQPSFISSPGSSAPLPALVRTHQRTWRCATAPSLSGSLPVASSETGLSGRFESRFEAARFFVSLTSLYDSLQDQRSDRLCLGILL